MAIKQRNRKKRAIQSKVFQMELMLIPNRYCIVGLKINIKQIQKEKMSSILRIRLYFIGSEKIQPCSLFLSIIHLTLSQLPMNNYSQPYPLTPINTNYEQQISQLNQNYTLPNPIETFELTPGCMYKCFMLPFPFFCIGCCLSQSSKFQFDNNNRILHLKTYCGYCACCSSNLDVPYDEIVGLDVRIQPGYYINRQPAYKVHLLSKKGEAELTGGMVLMQAVDTERQIQEVMKRCRIQVGQQRPGIPGTITIPIQYLY